MQDKLKKLEAVIQAIDTDNVSYQEFVDAFEQLVKFVNAIKEDNESDRDELEKDINEKIDNLTSRLVLENEKEWEDIKAKLEAIKPRDGVDGKDGKDGQNGLDGLNGKDGKDGSDASVNMEELVVTTVNYIDTLEGDDRIPMSAIKDLEDTIATLQNRTQLLNQMINARATGATSTSSGGGHIIEDEGVALTQRASLNFTGAGVTVTDSGGKTTVTINGGGGGGITRSVITTSGSGTMGSTALTDYVYLVSGAHTMTLPTAVSNTNRYTVKNNHSAAVTVNTTSAQTIDGSATISIQPSDSRDLISDNSNWYII
jgi:hypothetical protein